MTLAMGPTSATIVVPIAPAAATLPTGGSFSFAMAWVLDGAQVRRASWTAGAYVTMVTGVAGVFTRQNPEPPVQMAASFGSIMALRDAAGRCTAWVPTQTDLRATDWSVV